jgi:hypothetical protein
MIIDKDKISAYQFGEEMVHSACATPEEVREVSQEEIITDDDLERLEMQDKACFCDRCKQRISA